MMVDLREPSVKLDMQPAIVRNPSNPVHPQYVKDRLSVYFQHDKYNEFSALFVPVSVTGFTSHLIPQLSGDPGPPLSLRPG